VAIFAQPLEKLKLAGSAALGGNVVRFDRMPTPAINCMNGHSGDEDRVGLSGIRGESRHGEAFHGALDAIALTSGLRRVYGVEIGRFWLQALHAHAKNHIGMIPVHTIGAFRRLAKLRGIRTKMHDSVMLARTPRIVACPSDDGRMVVSVSQFEFWPVCDPDVRGCLSRGRKLLRIVRSYLSGDQV
jgi:hypothetical protein